MSDDDNAAAVVEVEEVRSVRGLVPQVVRPAVVEPVPDGHGAGHAADVLHWLLLPVGRISEDRR